MENLKKITFNTGFVCVSNPVFIPVFGGTGKKGIWEWRTTDDMNDFEDDAITVLNRLNKLEELGYKTPKFHEYDKDQRGTRELYNDLKKYALDWNEEFLLGCIIYHQLLYKSDLSSWFEE